MRYTITTQTEIRAGFAQQWADIVAQHPSRANDKPMKSEAFSFYIDGLAREGTISEALAFRATMAPEPRKPSKYEIVRVIQCKYVNNSWEDVSEYFATPQGRRDCMADLRQYNASNTPHNHTQYRVITRRQLKA